MVQEKKGYEGKYNINFGAIAVELGFITEEQLRAALAEQEYDDMDNRPHRLIGTILIEKGWMTIEQITEVLEERLKRTEASPGDASP